MKKNIAILLSLVLCLSLAFPVCAAEGKVTYSGSSGNFIFAPGSDYSPTDLFPKFKDVMPGDTLTQRITVKNNADNKVKVKIYLRSLGAHSDEESESFLSKLSLKVEKASDQQMAYMFDAAASETAQLTDWVCLGTLYSGGEVDLNVTLSVPTELNNDFQKSKGFLDWEFMVEEFPVEPTDPQAPQTGDASHVKIYFAAMVCAAVLMIILLIWRKKNKGEFADAQKH